MMSDAHISVRLLFLGLVMLGGGVIVVYAGVQFDDLTLLIAGGAAAAGRWRWWRSVCGVGSASGAAPSSGAVSVRTKLKHFWAPAADEPAAAGDRRRRSLRPNGNWG